jgi:hypothetical protein
MDIIICAGLYDWQHSWFVYMSITTNKSNALHNDFIFFIHLFILCDDFIYDGYSATS